MRSPTHLLAFLAISSAFTLSPQHGRASAPPLAGSSKGTLPAVTVTKPYLQQRVPTVTSTAASLEAATPPPESGVGVAPSIINLAKNIVGSGVLALAAGIAAFSGSRLALLPSVAILFAVGAVSAYTFSTIARVGAAVGANTYRDTWAKVFGEKTAFMPDITVVLLTACAALGYSIIIGDSFAGIAQLAGATGVLASSNAWILLLSAFVLLPLALLRDLSSLAIGSVIGTAGTCYTALFIFLRLLDRSYAPGGKFFGAIAASAQPAFAAPTAARPLLNSGIFVLLSMLASAFLVCMHPMRHRMLHPS